MRSVRLASIFTVVFILLFMFITPITALSEEIAFDAKLVNSVNIGNSFEIILSMNSNTNIKSVQFNVKYNPEYISYKSSSTLQSGELDTYDNNGNIGIIMFIDNTLNSGEAVSLTFTAEKGKGTSKQEIKFELVQAVDTNLNDVTVKFPNTVNVEITQKGEPTSGSVSKASSQKSTSSKSTVSKAVSSKNSSNKTSSKVTSAGKGKTSDSSDLRTSSRYEAETPDNTTSTEMSGRENDSGYLKQANGNGKYVLVGIGGTLAVIGILYVVFRLGQLSRRKQDSENRFNKK